MVASNFPQPWYLILARNTWSEPVLGEASELCQRLARYGLVVASDGNASIRRGDSIFITRTRSEFEALSVVDWREMALVGPPTVDVSSEWRMHQMIFQQLSEIRAIVHCHPVYATSFAFLGQGLDGKTLTETADLDIIPVVPLAPPGSAALAQGVVRVLEAGGAACLLAQHGALTTGATFLEAVQRMERLERLAHIQWLVTQRA